MKTMAKQRRSPHLPNYFKQMDRPEKDDHPIYLAVTHRLPQEAAQERRIARLRARVRAQLGKDVRALTGLETLKSDLGAEREEAYFNVGYEHGLAEGAARARRAAGSGAKKIARDVRERIVQAQVPPRQAMLALLECLYAVVLSEVEVPPEGAAR
jgi:hypothetical protein